MLSLQTQVLQLMMPGLNVLIKLYILVHLLTKNVYEFNMSKCINDFNRQCNMFLADFKYSSSHIRNVLFQRYYTSFYGTQMLPHFDTNIQDMYTAGRIAIRRVQIRCQIDQCTPHICL